MLADPLWYKDAVIYEVHVRAFHDSVGDGIGDFKGLTAKLDYLEDLGVTAVWLLPFYPSPLRDDGYDIADYTAVHPDYGRIADFKEFLDAAHKRGIRVITELVINHTSDQHPWFQRARRAPAGSPERDFYVWSDSGTEFPHARIIFKDFETSNWTYDNVTHAYFWHRFYSHQPDLNFDNPAVWEALFPVMDFWLDMGVDGMRLDAIPYLYEREGTNCENLPETHVFLKALRKRMDQKYPGRMFLAEANQWPEDAVAYFGDGDECHMSFHFPLMPRMFMAVRQEARFPIIDILEQTPAIPDNCQWCLFLRNHDELTLEMVTDEERDYMYRAYASDRTARINLGIRRRLAPLLGNDRRRIELMNALLFSLPGTPVLYYGDEIGMGDNIYLGDRNGVRTPMQWSSDRNAGFSRGNPQSLYLPVVLDPEYRYEVVNVENQQKNPSSLLWWMKRLIALRKRYQAFSRGSIEFLEPANSRILAFVRKLGDERILVVANLSHFAQHAELDLREHRGLVPMEAFGGCEFPPIGEGAYPLTLGQHGILWLVLKTVPAASAASPSETLLPVLAEPTLEAVFAGHGREHLEALLPAFLGRGVRSARFADMVRLEDGEDSAWLAVLDLEYQDGIPDQRILPLASVPPGEARGLLEPTGRAALARLEGEQGPLVVDALAAPSYCRGVLRAIASGRAMRLANRELAGMPRAALAEIAEALLAEPALTLRRGENSTTTLRIGQLAVLRTFRRVEEGANPDLEIGEALASRGFAGIAPILGHVELRAPKRGGEPLTAGVLHRWVPHQASAWQVSLDQLSRYFEAVATNPPQATEELKGDEAFFRLLGTRTAALHAALAELPGAACVPESMGRHYRRSLYQSLRNIVGQAMPRLRARAPRLPDDAAGMAEGLAARQGDLLDRVQALVRAAPEGLRIRTHGDYHLGQLLYTGASFVLTDFEGEPRHTLGERRVKRSPLRDVACMVLSLAHAAGSVLHGLAGTRGRAQGVIRGEDLAALVPAAEAWFDAAAQAFVGAYLSAAPPGLLPAGQEQRRVLLDVLLLEKGLQEIEAEMEHRPAWAVLPLRAVLRLLDSPPAGGLC